MEFLARHDADDGEERAGGFPAFGAAAGVVESDVGVEGDYDGLRRALAAKFATGAVVWLLRIEALVDGGVEGRHGWLSGFELWWVRFEDDSRTRMEENGE